MIQRTKATREELTLDPRNPRLHAMEGERTQRAIMVRHLGEYQAIRLACDMIDGRYLAAAPLLAVMENGLTVVIDGNRRLSAMHALQDASLAEEANVHEIPVGRAGEHRATSDAIPVIVMESRWEAMRARIAHEKAARSIWGHLAHARHYRELLREGMSAAGIQDLYGYDRWPHGLMSVQFKIEALLAMEQINDGLDHPWPGPGNYRRLEQTLRVPAVRGLLGMAITVDAFPGQETPPLPAEKLGQARRVMGWIQGSARNSGEFQQPRINLPEDAELLGKICSDDRALSLMDRRPWMSGRAVMDHLADDGDEWKPRDRMLILERLAREELQEMQRDPDSSLEVPGDIHLSDVSCELHSGGAVQFRVLLVSRDAERDGPVRAHLERRLRGMEGRKIRVELIADRPAG